MSKPKGMPHYPAAFINAIAEEGTKLEAVEWLQKIWNELCEAKRENARLIRPSLGSSEEDEMKRLGMAPGVSRGMSLAFKARSRACPKCGKKTIQPKQRHYWMTDGHRCRWCGLGIKETP